MNWDFVEQGPRKPNASEVIGINIQVDSASTSASASGNRLWRAALFRSSSPNGVGPRVNTKIQILNKFHSSRSLTGGRRMRIDGVQTEYDMDEFTCETDYQYLCLEFTKSRRPKPKFMMTIEGGGKSIIKCKLQECERGKV